jgi:hypothetical protein
LATTLACFIIPRAYINPVIYTVYSACLLAIDAPAYSSSHTSFLSLSSALNAVDLRKNCRLMLITILQYAAIVYFYPILIWLSRFNASRNLSVIYLRPLELASYIYDDTASFSYTNASNCC